MEEVFVRIEDYPKYYVSNLGRVLSLKGKKERFLKVRIGKDGYYYVTLNKKGKKKSFKIHRLVAKTFISNPNNLPCVNHKDENKLNNCVDNLEWCTWQYNSNYGTAKIRWANKNKRRVACYTLSGEFVKEYDGIIDSERDGFKHSTVSAVCKGKRNQHHGYKFAYL